MVFHMVSDMAGSKSTGKGTGIQTDFITDKEAILPCFRDRKIGEKSFAFGSQNYSMEHFWQSVTKMEKSLRSRIRFENRNWYIARVW